MFRLTILLLGLSNLCVGYDYCYLQRDCPDSKKHIGCQSEGSHKKLANLTQIPLSKKLRENILDIHNKYRNELSCGTVEDINDVPFPPAAKMREVKWDVELEYLAGLHAAQCSLERDDCHITSRFKHVGQSLGSITGELPSIAGFHVSAALQELVKQWFNQHKLASYRGVQNYQNEAQTGEFFQIINDRVSRIGCALTLCHFKPKDNMFLFTCNYSYRNVNDEEVYTVGATTTKCDRVNSRRSQNYRCLCEASDV